MKFCVVRWENQNSSQSFTLSFFSNFNIYKGFYNQWVCSENVFKVYQICWFNFFLLLKRTKPVKLEKVMEWHSTCICLNGWFEISKMYCFVPDRLAGEAQSGTVYCLYVKKIVRYHSWRIMFSNPHSTTKYFAIQIFPIFMFSCSSVFSRPRPLWLLWVTKVN